MIVKGEITEARQAGNTLARVTIAADKSGAMSHSRNGGETIPVILVVSKRNSGKDKDAPIAVPITASRPTFVITIKTMCQR